MHNQWMYEGTQPGHWKLERPAAGATGLERSRGQDTGAGQTAAPGAQARHPALFYLQLRQLQVSGLLLTAPLLPSRAGQLSAGRLRAQS